MDDDEFDVDDDVIGVVVLPPRPLSRLDLLAFSLWAVARVAEVVETVASEFSDLLAAHDSYQRGRAQLAEQAALEIETMMGGKDG